MLTYQSASRIPKKIYIFNSSFCSIKLYKTKEGNGGMNELSKTEGGKGSMKELSGSDDEDLKMPYVGKDMRFAEYFKTQGTCCWELFKKKEFKGKNRVLKEGAPYLTKNDEFGIKSVKRVNC